ncbi:hypothetical protein [Puniceibacterium sp. IMCC21224]|uniref:hypothetical protein n=1 Tax=Puniceibacterium sp. IMCC21224 TaxID=1618204 RepID=UPI00065D0DAE|nr:hypothetical protein [Puniceibacterium sp. IMCC21224]KMK68698.1 hypothetical protein IMCC21224_113583 [Puniceibacterium sp. IMCC21224]
MGRIVTVGAALVAAVILALPAGAQDLIERTELSRKPLSGSDVMEVVLAKLVIHPGGYIPKHTHPGDENSVVAVGGQVILPNGKEVPFAADTPLNFAEGVVHGGLTVAGDMPITIYTTHIVDKTKPFQTLAE